MGSLRRYRLAAVTMMPGIVVALASGACGDGYGEEDSTPAALDGAANDDQSSDAGIPAVAEDAAPSINCPLGCLPPAPAGWTGPSAVYDGDHATRPTACPPLYTQKERDGQDGKATQGAATCDCGVGTIQGAKCTVAVSSYTALDCSTKGTFVTKDVPGTTCIDRAASTSAMKVAVTTVPGTCTYPNAKITAAPPAFAKAAIACGLPQYASCTERTDCVASPIPEAPFTRLCIHKAGDELCPSLDYAARLTTFATVKDERSCACAGTPDVSCSGTLSYYDKDPGCVGPTGLGNPGACVSALSVGVGSVGPFVKGCKETKLPTAVGEVGAADVVTFCCNK